MSINLNITKHSIAFPTKLLASNGGEHILNIVLTADADNGSIVSAGDYASFDQYEEGTVPTGYKATIVDVAADGNFYVQVVEPADAVFIYEVPEIAENYDSRFTATSNFYNESGKTVRGYVLHKYDIYELSKEAFTGTPAVGATVTVTGRKHVIGE